MAPTNGIPIRQWLIDHGVNVERVEPFTVHHDPGKETYYLNGDEKAGYSPGDLTGARVTHRDWPGWTFDLDLSGSGGVYALSASLDREARLRGETITVRRLRDVPIADMTLAVRAAFALNNQGTVFDDLGLPIRQRESGPSPISDLQLAQAMAVYLDAVADGHSTKEAAQRFFVSKSTMDNYRNRAKQRGLFVTHGRGKPGGDLTPKAWALLKEGSK